MANVRRYGGIFIWFIKIGEEVENTRSGKHETYLSILLKYLTINDKIISKLKIKT
jgi:hypothetical protein